MWWERWIPESCLTSGSICGIECLFDDTGVSYYYSVLQKKKNAISVSDSGKTSNISDILKLSKKIVAPISIVITGKGVIIKKILFSENDSLALKDLTKQYLPTIQPEEFYIQFYKSSHQSGHLSICRKEQVNELVRQFSQEKSECVNIYIGPLVVNALSVITSAYNKLSASVYQLGLVNGVIETIQPFNSNDIVPLQADDFKVEVGQLISFASGFSYLTQQTIFISENGEITSLSSKHAEKLKLKIVLLVFIAFLFLISVINSLLFFRKFEEDNLLKTELNLYESKHEKITQLLNNYQKKKTLIEQAGIFDHKKLSVYADKIAASLPQDIVLRELHFNPEEGEAEEDSLINFSENQLIIKGNCHKSLLLNEWINVLKNQDFIKSVNLENFRFNSEEHLPNFVLKLEVN